ncbi:hypothetical protein BVC93_13755 [Mycobacterium sp. MS1601]|uniref:GntR family transcriptional regulator n=1 Tax=Mycobacterium sp. MS1601 TaxID=1936029 RepID=UPI0009794754|nr:GntR family transcriptional regulator [Mycobacterium sp. MS1601]AQA03303.1 hypothetical protein BVC93_13755 [Mycobacterium sp. MS1601]
MGVQQSLADDAYELILERILDGRLEPGSALSVPALARSTNLGRSPVREAVQRLIYEGLAQHVHNRGAVITKLRPADLPDIFEAKEPLEGIAARRAAANVTDADLEKLWDLVDQQTRAAETTPVAAGTLMRLDVEFHLLIAELSGSATLLAVLGQFTTRTHLVVPAAWNKPVFAQASIDEHAAMVRAIASADTHNAEQAAASHTRNVCTRLMRWLAEDQASLGRTARRDAGLHAVTRHQS